MREYFGSRSPQEGLGRQSLHGGAMLLIARVMNAVVQIGCALFLARLLTPEDYGLVAMVTALTGFASILVDLGTRDAIVQRTSITEGEISTLFWVSLGVGCTFMLVISGSAPLIAGFYKDPRLTAIVLVSSLTFVISAFTAQHQALLRRAVMFRELAIIEVAANLLSAGSAIGMARLGFTYWALVMRPVLMCALLAAGVWWYCKWRPSKPILTAGVKQMVKFGLYLCGFSMVDFAGRNVDRVVIGRVLGAITLGYYQNALLIYENLLSMLVMFLHPVAVASLSKLQDDLEALRRSWAKALATVVFYAMPAFGILAVTSGDLIVILLGEKWATAGALLSVLALRGIPHSAERTLGWLHVVAGRTDRWLRWGIVETCVHLVALSCGLPFGLFGVVYAYVVSMYVLFLPALAYAGQPLNIGAGDVIAAIGAEFVGALTAAGVGFTLRALMLTGLPAIERMAILVLVYLAMYLMVTVGLFRVTVPVQVILSLVKDALPGRLKSMVTSKGSR